MYKYYIVKLVRENLFEGLGIEGKPPNPKKFEYFPALTVEELRGKRVFLILNNPLFFYEIYGLNLPVYSEEIIRLRLTDRVNTAGYFTEPFSLFWKILKREGNFYELAYLALGSRELLRVKTLLKDVARCKLEGIAFLPFALAKASEEIKEEVFLVYGERGVLWILILKEGFPQIIEFFQIDELLGINYGELLGRLNFLKNLFYRDHHREITKVFLFQREHKEELEKGGFEVILKEREYSEFLFAPLVDPAFNLLSEEERAIKEVLERNYKISFALSGLAVIILSFGLYLKKANSNLEREIQRKEALITESINRFLSEYPEEKIKNFRVYLEEREKLLKMPLPQEILGRLILACQDAKITSLEVKETNSTYQINFSGEKTGQAEEITLFSQEFLKKLRTFVEIQQTQFDYSQEKGTINFKVSGVIKP